MDARLLSPDPEHLGASTAVASGGHQMPPRPEMTVDHAVRGEESLRLPWRLEPLHLPFPSSRRPVRILSAIIQPPAHPVPHIRHDSATGRAVAAQAVGDQTARFVLESSQKPLEEARGGFRIAAALDQDVEHNAILVDRAPEIMKRAVDANEDLVQVPDVTWPWPAFAEPLGAKLAAPTRQVIAVLGDGAYMFANPTACHYVAQMQNLPVLTVVYNNALYNAVRRATLDMYAHGVAAEADGRFMAELPTPAFEKIMEAHDGHGERVDRPADLPAALQRAAAAVRAGRQAVVNVVCR